MPAITVRNRQRAIKVQLPTLQSFAEFALGECLRLPAKKSGRTKHKEISVVLVSDRRMAGLHRRFLDEAGPTDVITFQHGEIVISVETARGQARLFRTSLNHEIRLYIVHGLLHLAGYEDRTRAGAVEMKRLQEKLVARAIRSLAFRRYIMEAAPPGTGPCHRARDPR